ncbi:MAG: PAS domain S-box protein [Armatimonadetes bacterium]|nr:PAS domain S-box protein [Armatimonadota bacterium]
MCSSDQATSTDDLRRQAEQLVEREPATGEAPAAALQHELMVHQIELAMQGDELRRTLVDLEASRDRYADLYEFAPVGFVTLNDAGLITGANLACAALLGRERGRLLERRLGQFVAGADQAAYYGWLRPLLDDGAAQRCELRLVRPDGAARWVRLDALALPTGEPDLRFQVALSDITERREAVDALRQANDDLELRVRERTAELARANERLRALALELVLAEERARRQLGADLHDGLCQALALLRLRLVLAADEPAARPPDPATMELLNQAHEMARSLTLQLGTPLLYDLGLLPAAEGLAQEFERHHGLRVTLQDDGKPKPLDESARVILFRGLRELLLKVVKHAGVAAAEVRLERGGELVHLTVEDQGAGCDPAGSGGFGLYSLRERVVPLGGRLEIRSARGAGTTVTLTVPLSPPEARELGETYADPHSVG